MSPEDYATLRQHFDGNDRFTDKPNIRAVRLSKAVIPEWLRDDNGGLEFETVKQLVKRKFPRAGRRNPQCEGNCARCLRIPDDDDRWFRATVITIPG